MMAAVTDATLSKHDQGIPPAYLVFMIIWVTLGFSGFLFFHFNRNATLKRRVLPVSIITFGLLFGGFIYFTVGKEQPQVLYFLVPAIILISFLNLRSTLFCGSCGKTLYRQSVFTRKQFCQHCGVELQ